MTGKSWSGRASGRATWSSINTTTGAARVGCRGDLHRERPLGGNRCRCFDCTHGFVSVSVRDAGLYGADAPGSRGGAGRGAHATIVHGFAIICAAEARPPRRAGQARARVVDSGRPVCATARRPISAAADSAPPLDCPRGLLGCRRRSGPLVGSATRSNSGRALPHLIRPPGGSQKRHRHRCALPVPWMPLATPHRGLCGSLRS